jgi:hypothetical protein
MIMVELKGCTIYARTTLYEPKVQISTFSIRDVEVGQSDHNVCRVLRTRGSHQARRDTALER